MKLIPIKDVIADKISGEWGEEALDGQGVVVIRTANFLNSGRINFSNLVRRKIDQKKVEKKRLISGDIIIEKSGGSPTQPVGRVVIFQNPDNDIYLCNNFTSILRPRKNEVHPEYLFYILHNNHKKGKTLRHQNKTTGIINLKLDSYLGSEIPLPPLDDQIRIAHLLGKVEELIVQRKQHLQQLDDLLRSVFLAMFGDPVRNEKGWMRLPLEKLGSLNRGVSKRRPRNAPELLGGKYPLIQTGEVSNAGTYITTFSNTYSDIGLAQSKMWPSGTLCITIAANIAQTGVLTFDSCFPDSVVAFSAFEKEAHVLYVHGLFWFFQKILEKNAPAAAQKNINLEILRGLEVPKPPIELQAQFVVAVGKIEGIKTRYQQSLADLEALYGALSQQAFRGELDLSRVPLPGMEPEEEKAVITEPVQASAEENLAINLPDTDNLLEALENAEARKALIAQWLEAYRGQLGTTSFSVQHFMVAAQTRLAKLHPDNDFELGVNDYKYIKAWVFRALIDGRLQQTRNITGHNESDKPIFGNLIEIKSGAHP